MSVPNTNLAWWSMEFTKSIGSKCILCKKDLWSGETSDEKNFCDCFIKRRITNKQIDFQNIPKHFPFFLSSIPVIAPVPIQFSFAPPGYTIFTPGVNLHNTVTNPIPNNADGTIASQYGLGGPQGVFNYSTLIPGIKEAYPQNGLVNEVPKNVNPNNVSNSASTNPGFEAFNSAPSNRSCEVVPLGKNSSPEDTNQNVIDPSRQTPMKNRKTMTTQWLNKDVKHNFNGQSNIQYPTPISGINETHSRNGLVSKVPENLNPNNVLNSASINPRPKALNSASINPRPKALNSASSNHSCEVVSLGMNSSPADINQNVIDPNRPTSRKDRKKTMTTQWLNKDVKRNFNGLHLHKN